MNTARHTPAPWVVDFDLSRLNIMTEDGKVICTMRRWLADQINFTDDVVRANARLISESPAILAALTQLAFMARTSGTPTPELLRACEGAEALIAKTGELHG